MSDQFNPFLDESADKANPFFNDSINSEGQDGFESINQPTLITMDSDELLDNTEHSYVITTSQDSPGSTHDFEVVSAAQDISKESGDIHVVTTSEIHSEIHFEREMDLGDTEDTEVTMATGTTKTVFEIPGMDTFDGKNTSFGGAHVTEVRSNEFEVPIDEDDAQTHIYYSQTTTSESTDVSSLEMRANKFLMESKEEIDFESPQIDFEPPPVDVNVVESSYSVIEFEQSSQPLQSEEVITEYNVLTDEVEAIDSSLTEADQSETQLVLDFDPINTTVESSRPDERTNSATSETNPFLDGDSIELETETKTTVVYTYESIDDNNESNDNLNNSRSSAVDLNISRGSGIDLDVCKGSANDLNESRDSGMQLNISKGSTSSETNPFLDDEDEAEGGNPFLDDSALEDQSIVEIKTETTETTTLSPGGINELHKLLDSSFQSNSSEEPKNKPVPSGISASETSSRDKTDGTAFMAPLMTVDTPQPYDNTASTYKVDGGNISKPPPKYTSLDDEQHVTNIMRSVSMDDTDRVSIPCSEDSMADLRDLFVRVESPEKHVEGYVSYSVVTKTTRGDFKHPDYEVRRRYQDFLWLRQKLEETNPTHIIPPLPEKFTFSKHVTNRFDQDFLKTRQKALDKFLQRIADHAVMSFNEHFKTFLTVKAWEMTGHRKQSTSAMQVMGGKMRNTAAQMMMKNRSEEFTEIGKYNIQFRAKMVQFGKIADEIAKERFYLLDDYGEYGSGFRLWANSESKLSDTLRSVSQSFDRGAESLKLLLRAHESRVCEPIREYTLYCDAVKEALKRRDNFQMEHELTTDELAKKKTERDEIHTTGQAKSIQTFFGKDPEKVKEERLDKLNQQISDLTTEAESLADRHEKADTDFRVDMERWQKNKRRDMKALLLELAERHIKYYEASVNAWQETMDVISSKPRPGGTE